MVFDIGARIVGIVNGREYLGTVIGHAQRLDNIVCYSVKFDEPVRVGTKTRAQWPIPAQNLKPSLVPCLAVHRAIEDAGLVFDTIVVASTSVRGVLTSHRADGWALVGRHGAGAGRTVLAFATLASPNKTA